MLVFDALRSEVSLVISRIRLNRNSITKESWRLLQTSALFLLNAAPPAAISGAVSSSGSAGRPCGACNLGSTFAGRSVSGRVSSSVHTGSRVYASAKPENSNESNLPSENLEEEIETIQGLKAENGDKDDADQVSVISFCIHC